ncbi:MAG: hypothetical protein GWN31_06825 [Candidatus Thorarchaeota archaeon]|nr:hypothetical protein [Candidatus Thorarchaeota archaeon]
MLVKEIKIGDTVNVPADGKFHPERGHRGKLVWKSEDGKSVAIQCERNHNGKKTVFLVKNNSKK